MYKIRIKDEEQSRQIQEILFELGYKWPSYPYDKVRRLDKKYMYIYENSLSLNYGLSEDNFIHNRNEEIIL